MRAKLFGHTADAPLLWRAADVVVARARPGAVARVLAVGARMIAFAPDDGAGRALVAALEARRIGVGAQGPLMVSGALEGLLAAARSAAAAGGERLEGEDGAAHCADVAWVVGRARVEIMAEQRAADRAETGARVEAAAAAARAAERQRGAERAAAGELE